MSGAAGSPAAESPATGNPATAGPVELGPATGPSAAGARAVVELAHAFVLDAADVADVRILVIKGLAAHRQRLRDARTPADVDVLTPPLQAAVLGAELAARGWLLRPVDADEAAFPRHALTYFHPGWSCDIDVHFRYPGLGDDAAPVFERLWSGRATVVVGGVAVPVPEPSCSAIVLALHCLRSPWAADHRAGYADIVRRSGELLDADVVVSAATDLGALPAVRPFLRDAFGVDVPPGGDPSAEWRLRTSLASPLARRLEVFLCSSWRARVHLVRLALVPPPSTLGKDGATLPGAAHPGGWAPRLAPALARAYARRWLRGIAGARGAIHDVRAFRRTTGRSDGSA